MQERPICFQCDSPIQTNAELVFEAPCGHDACSSAVFHPLCLFDWREKRTRWEEWFNQVREKWAQEHQQHGDEDA